MTQHYTSFDNVLIVGRTASGKTVLAKNIQNFSPSGRKVVIHDSQDDCFETVRCASTNIASKVHPQSGIDSTIPIDVYTGYDLPLDVELLSKFNHIILMGLKSYEELSRIFALQIMDSWTNSFLKNWKNEPYAFIVFNTKTMIATAQHRCNIDKDTPPIKTYPEISSFSGNKNVLCVLRDPTVFAEKYDWILHFGNDFSYNYNMKNLGYHTLKNIEHVILTHSEQIEDFERLYEPVPWQCANFIDDREHLEYDNKKRIIPGCPVIYNVKERTFSTYSRPVKVETIVPESVEKPQESSMYPKLVPKVDTPPMMDVPKIEDADVVPKVENVPVVVPKIEDVPKVEVVPVVLKVEDIPKVEEPKTLLAYYKKAISGSKSTTLFVGNTPNSNNCLFKFDEHKYANDPAYWKEVNTLLYPSLRPENSHVAVSVDSFKNIPVVLVSLFDMIILTGPLYENKIISVIPTCPTSYPCLFSKGAYYYA